MRSVLVVAAACSAPARPQALTNVAPDQPVLVLRMERGACEGRCPDYPEYTIEIASDGHVMYRGIDHVQLLGERGLRIEPATLRQILDAFDAAKFFTLDSSLCLSDDEQTTKVEIVRAGRRHIVSSAPSCIRALDKAESLVDELTGVRPWIGQRADSDIDIAPH